MGDFLGTGPKKAKLKETEENFNLEEKSLASEDSAVELHENKQLANLNLTGSWLLNNKLAGWAFLITFNKM